MWERGALQGKEGKKNTRTCETVVDAIRQEGEAHWKLQREVMRLVLVYTGRGRERSAYVSLGVVPWKLVEQKERSIREGGETVIKRNERIIGGN